MAQVGTRDLATRTIRRGFAPAPLRDFLATGQHRRAGVAAATRRASATRSRTRTTRGRAPSTAPSARPASARQSTNRYHLGLGSWTRTLSPTAVNSLRVSYSDYDNAIEPVTPGRQLTFPSIQDGASFRVPQATTQRRLQLTDALSLVRGRHAFRLGAEVSRTKGDFFLGVFREGRVELVQDFPQFDLNRDGRVDDNDLLFAVTLRSGKPDQDLLLERLLEHVPRVLRPGRLARHAAAHPEPRACATSSTRT